MVLQGGQDAFCEGGDGLVDEIAVGAEVALEADAEVFSLGVIAGKCANDGMTVIAGEGSDEAVAPVDREDNRSDVLVGIEGDTAFTVAQVKAKITHNSPHWDRNKRINTRKNYGREANSIARRGQGGGTSSLFVCPLWGLGQRPNRSTGDQFKGKSQQRCRQRSVPASNFALPQKRPPKLLSPTRRTLPRQMGATDLLFCQI